MNPLASLRRVIATMGLTIATLAALAGCFNPWDPREAGLGVTEPPPVPSTPGGVLRLLEWCYDHRAIAEYREIFSDDYRFVFAALDPYGNAYRSQPWTREDEVESTTHLFQGGDANQPAATSITIVLDRSFRVTTLTPWRTLIRTSVILHVITETGEQSANGYANFFLVRGDSALIPLELSQKGVQPDSNRWYIQRHEDETFADESGGGTAARARPATAMRLVERTWGYFKAVYR
jgi:hypothetical protein